MDTTSKSSEDLTIDLALKDDVPSIKPMIDAAYSKYIDRIGRLPAPMTADYFKVIETRNVYVLRVKGSVVGSIYLSRDGDAMKINDLVVDPSAQGCGYGRMLMQYAESMALAHGLAAMSLFTNEKMHENIIIYRKMGFTETERKAEDGYNRVFFRKELVWH